MKNKEFNLKVFKENLGLKRDSRKDFKRYNKFFPNLDFRTFIILNHHGKLGRLKKGLRIDIPEKNIFIPQNEKVLAYFISNGTPLCP